MSGGPVGVLAQGLRSLRDNAEGPVGAELEQVTGLRGRVVADALEGRELPSLAVTLALVDAWGGDVEAWEKYWGKIADLARPKKGDEGAATTTTIPETVAEPAEAPAPEKTAAKPSDPTDPADTRAAAPHMSAMPPPPPTPSRDEEKGKGDNGGAGTGTGDGASISEEPAAARPRPRWALRIAMIAVVLLVAEAGYLSYDQLTKHSNDSSTQQPGIPTGTAPPADDTESPALSSSATTSPASTSTSTPTLTLTSSPSFPTPSDTATTAFSTPVPGSQLGVYPKVQLPSGYSVDFLHDTFHPVLGTTLGGDTMGLTAAGPLDGRFLASQAVVFDVDEPGTFERCLNDTRYQQNVEISGLSVGSLFCVHALGGELVLVKVDRLPQTQDTNPYAVIDLTVWQGR